MRKGQDHIFAVNNLSVPLPGEPNPASYKNCGSCVVFPLPVSPHTTTTGLRRTASIIGCSSATTGSSNLDSCTSSGRNTEMNLRLDTEPSLSTFPEGVLENSC